MRTEWVRLLMHGRALPKAEPGRYERMADPNCADGVATGDRGPPTQFLAWIRAMTESRAFAVRLKLAGCDLCNWVTIDDEIYKNRNEPASGCIRDATEVHTSDSSHKVRIPAGERDRERCVNSDAPRGANWSHNGIRQLCGRSSVRSTSFQETINDDGDERSPSETLNW